MEQSDMLTDHERRISHLEGKLDSLATKELVLQANAELLREINRKFDHMNDDMNKKFDDVNAKFDTVNAKFDGVNEKFEAINGNMQQQTRELSSKIDDTNKRINEQDRKYTKLAGIAVAIAFILSLLVGVANLVIAAFEAGLIQIP